VRDSSVVGEGDFSSPGTTDRRSEVNTESRIARSTLGGFEAKQ